MDNKEEKTMKAADGVAQAIDAHDETVKLDTASVSAGTEPAAPAAEAPPAPAGDAADAAQTPVPEPGQTPPADSPGDTAKVKTPAEHSNLKVILLIVGAIVLFIAGIALAVMGYVGYGIVGISLAAILVLLAVFLPIK